MSKSRINVIVEVLKKSGRGGIISNFPDVWSIDDETGKITMHFIDRDKVDHIVRGKVAYCFANNEGNYTTCVLREGGEYILHHDNELSKQAALAAI